MTDTVVYTEGDYLILRSERLFSNGFNCYKKTGTTDEEYTFQKINPADNWFTNLEAAKDWLNEYKRTAKKEN